jgi:hypothetical protein
MEQAVCGRVRRQCTQLLGALGLQMHANASASSYSLQQVSTLLLNSKPK